MRIHETAPQAGTVRPPVDRDARNAAGENARGPAGQAPIRPFGKPEVLEQFNALARQASRDSGADWLDVYEPTRRHPDKSSLFTADGVRVSNLGNRLLALEILKYLGSGGSAKD